MTTTEKQEGNSERHSFPERRELYEEGLSDQEIAEEVGVPNSTINSWRRRRGLPANKNGPLSEEEEARRRELYEKGLSDQEIAEKVGVTDNTIHSWRKRRGLSRSRRRTTVQNPMIEEYLDDCSMKNLAESTIDNKRYRLAKFEGFLDKPLEKARVRDVNDFLNKLSEGYLFSTDELVSNEKLNQSSIPRDLKNIFREENHQLSEDASLSVERDSKRWKIIDKDKTYLLKKEGKRLNIYSERNLASSTIAHFLSDLRGLFDYIDQYYPEIETPDLRRISEKEFRPQPWEDIERKPLSRREMRKLIQAPDNLRDSLLISLIYHSVLRAGDAANLKRAQVDRENRKLKNLVRKGNKVDSVPYPRKLDRAIDRWISKVRKSYVNAERSPYFFVSKHGKKLTVHTIREIVRSAAEEAGIQEVVYEKPNGNKIWKVFTHILRITGATHAIEDGVSVLYLKKIMSHEELKTTLRYAKPAEDKIFNSFRRNFDGV